MTINGSFSCSITAGDDNTDDTVTYSEYEDNEYMTVNSANGAVSWTFPNDNSIAGVTTFKVLLTDDNTSDDPDGIKTFLYEFTAPVRSINTAPVLGTIPCSG